jgi:glucose/arabinose dehydrogenase
MRLISQKYPVFALLVGGTTLACTDDSSTDRQPDASGTTTAEDAALSTSAASSVTNNTSATGGTFTSDAPTSSSFDGGPLTPALDAGTLDGSIADGSIPDDGDAASTVDAALDETLVDSSSPQFPPSAEIANAWVPEGFAAWEWSGDLGEPRGVTVDGKGTVLVVEQDEQRVLALWDEDGDGISSSGERAVIATAPGLNHGIALNGGYLYASSATTVYRWAYNDTHVDLGEPEQVISAIPAGGHSTRTLLFDDTYLYVSVGSASNVDPDSARARIHRFPIADLGTSRAFSSGELFADGLRNEVGLALDDFGQIWGVENGMDDLSDVDFGGDIHNTNPGEELNLFSEVGDFYGYPYCWSEFLIPGDAGAGVGAQWWLEGSGDGVDDAWCKDPNNVVPPELVFPAHVAPLGIHFYYGDNFPGDYVGDALVTFHGSWNAEPPAGYKVIRVRMDDTGRPTGGWAPLYQFEGPGDTGDGWSERPVSLATLPDGTVLVTSDDDADRIVAIKYIGNK